MCCRPSATGGRWTLGQVRAHMHGMHAHCACAGREGGEGGGAVCQGRQARACALRRCTARTCWQRACGNTAHCVLPCLLACAVQGLGARACGECAFPVSSPVTALLGPCTVHALHPHILCEHLGRGSRSRKHLPGAHTKCVGEAHARCHLRAVCHGSHCDTEHTLHVPRHWLACAAHVCALLHTHRAGCTTCQRS